MSPRHAENRVQTDADLTTNTLRQSQTYGMTNLPGVGERARVLDKKRSPARQSVRHSVRVAGADVLTRKSDGDRLLN